LAYAKPDGPERLRAAILAAKSVEVSA
jgi:hypothetical protein